MNTKYTSISLLLALAASGTNTWGRTYEALDDKMLDGILDHGISKHVAPDSKSMELDCDSSQSTALQTYQLNDVVSAMSKNSSTLEHIKSTYGYVAGSNTLDNEDRFNTAAAASVKTNSTYTAANIQTAVVDAFKSIDVQKKIDASVTKHIKNTTPDAKKIGTFDIKSNMPITDAENFFKAAGIKIAEGLGGAGNTVPALETSYKKFMDADNIKDVLLDGQYGILGTTDTDRKAIFKGVQTHDTFRLIQKLSLLMKSAKQLKVNPVEKTITFNVAAGVAAPGVASSFAIDFGAVMAKRSDAIVALCTDLALKLSKLNDVNPYIKLLDNIRQGTNFVNVLDKAVRGVNGDQTAIYRYLNTNERINTLQRRLQNLLFNNLAPGAGTGNVQDFNAGAAAGPIANPEDPTKANIQLLHALGLVGDGTAGGGRTPFGEKAMPHAVVGLARANEATNGEMEGIFGAANTSLIGGVGGAVTFETIERSDATLPKLFVTLKKLNAASKTVRKERPGHVTDDKEILNKAVTFELKFPVKNNDELSSIAQINTFLEDAKKTILDANPIALEANKIVWKNEVEMKSQKLNNHLKSLMDGSYDGTITLKNSKFKITEIERAIKKVEEDKAAIMAILNKQDTPVETSDQKKEKAVAKVVAEKLEVVKKNDEIKDTTEDDLKLVLTDKNWTANENGILDVNNQAVADAALVEALKAAKAAKVATQEAADALQKEEKIKALAKTHGTTLDVLTQVVKDKKWVIENGEILSTDKKKISDADIKKAIEAAKKSENKKITDGEGEKEVKNKGVKNKGVKEEEGEETKETQKASEEAVNEAQTTLKEIGDLEEFKTALKDIEASTLKEIDIDEAVSGLEEEDQEKAKETLSKMIEDAKAEDNTDQEENRDNKVAQKDVDAAVKRIKATKNRKELQNEIEKIEKDNPTLLADLDEKKLSDYVTFKNMYAKMDFKKAILRARKASGTKEVSEEKDAITDKKGKKVEARKGRKVQARKGRRVQVSKGKKAALNADKKVAARRRGRNNRKSGLARNKSVRSKSAGRKSNTVA